MSLSLSRLINSRLAIVPTKMARTKAIISIVRTSNDHGNKNSNVGPALLGEVALKSIWPNYSGPPDCLRGPL